LEAAMPLYCGIDLHSNNHVICVIDDKDKRLLEIKLDNYSELTIRALSKYKKRLKAIAVVSIAVAKAMVKRKARTIARMAIVI
jgi:hypothetical protein